MATCFLSQGCQWIHNNTSIAHDTDTGFDSNNWDVNRLTNVHNTSDLDNLCISLNDLLVKYSCNSQMAFTGGMQQLVNKLESKPHSKQRPNENQNDELSLQSLPDCILLHILSFLDAKELCIVSQVSKHLESLSSDDLLWKDRLYRDMYKWQVTEHTTFPQTYKECNSDWTNKRIYMKCSPDIQDILRSSTMNFQNLSKLLRSMLPKKTPKLAMFGPGLESKTSRIVRNILENSTGLFSVHGMFPGKFEGVGSGFMVKAKNGTAFNLVTLYTSTRRERENMTEENRLQHNRLLEPNYDSASSNHVEVRSSVRDLCRTLDGLVFVTDVSESTNIASSAKKELKAMLNEMWAQQDIPLLVVAAVHEDSCSLNRQVINVAEDLQLALLNRPWQVRFCNVSTLEGLSESFEWIVHSAQFR